MNLLFSDHFDVDPARLDEYGAFNISLLADLPLFIDPFLLFNSEKDEYQQLHAEMIKYLVFLRNKSANSQVTPGLLDAWYRFKEVKQTWLGFARVSNRGSALGLGFARALNDNFHRLFGDYGSEQVTRGSHLEKLCLIQPGVGRDNISDFTTNLIKSHLLTYTAQFTTTHLSPQNYRCFTVPRVRFNYTTESWESGRYLLPLYNRDFVLLVPRDILTRDDTWINRSDLIDDFEFLPAAISDAALRAQVDNYFRQVLSRHPRKEPTKQEKQAAILQTIDHFPILIDYFIRYKEDRGDTAAAISNQRVGYARNLFLEKFVALVQLLGAHTDFYQYQGDTYAEALKRCHYLKQVIEHNDGYRLFYGQDGKPIKREEDLQVAYKFTWFGSPDDVNREVNNGRGPVDFKISRGAADKTLVEFKLASNTHLRRNLEKQVAIYEAANQTQKSIKVILYFTAAEYRKVTGYLQQLKLDQAENVILIDARGDNKPSASTA